MSQTTRDLPILALATLSGAVALVYEVVFFRSLGLIFGVNVHAVAAVVSAFLGGLGLGAFAGGRFLTGGAPLRIYAALELGVAACGLTCPWLFRLAGAHAAEDAPGSFPVATLAMAFLLLLPPTALMGATFPVLGRAVAAGAPDVARRIGRLYGMNTLGAFVGVLAGAFFLLPTFGMGGATRLAAALNVGLALLALWLARGRTAASQPIAAERAAPPTGLPGAATGVDSPPHAAILVAVVLVGFASIALQVLGNRLLVTLLGASIYAFACVLAVFLAGIGAGALFAGRLARARAPIAALASCAVLLGGALGLGLWLLRLKLGAADPLYGAINLYMEAKPKQGILPYLRVSCQLAALAFLPATLLSGVFLPAATRFFANDDARLARGLGSIYLWNTVGSIAGSLAAGFFLLPRLGLRISLGLAAGSAVLAGVVLLAAALRRHESRAALHVGSAIALSGLLLGAGLRPGGEPGKVDKYPYDTLFYAESEASAVKVIEFPEANEAPRMVRSLTINGKVVASSLFIDRRLQLLLGFIPTLIHPHPERILSIALGTGMSSGALAVSGAASVDIVELSRGVIDACYLFDEWNGHVDQRRNVTMHNDDGRRYLTRSTDRYDLISADPIHPWVAGSAYLYTVEYYRIARAHLREGGMMTQWIPLYQLSTEDIAGVVRSFSDVFPHVSAWFTGYDMVLLGCTAPLEVDADLVAQRMLRQPVHGMLATIGVFNPHDLLGCYFAGHDTLLRLAARAPGPITDDRPWIEFTAPQSLFELYASEIFLDLANSGDRLPLASAAGEEMRENILNASEKLRRGAIRFATDVALGAPVGEARAEYSDLIREGYRRGEELLPRDDGGR